MSSSVDRSRQRILVLGLHLVALAVLVLQIVVRRFPPTATALPEPGSPEANWWGLWPITYLPNGAFIVGVGAIVACIAYCWWRELASQKTQRPRNESESKRSWAILLSISGLLLVAFFIFPIVHTRWGDAYIISRSIAWPTEDFRLTHTWQAPLDVYLHSRVWLLLRPYVEWQDAVPLYRILSPIAGALYLGALLMFSSNRSFAPAWLTYGLVATLGVIQLFFGYVENYSFAVAMTLVYLWLGIECAQRKRKLWPAATTLALANVFHPSSIVLLPSMGVLIWIRLREFHSNGNKDLADDVLYVGRQVLVPMGLIYGLTWLMMELGDHGLTALLTTDKPGGGDARWLVPLYNASTQWERYTMFSWPHLGDFINEQLLVAPVVLPSLLWMAVAKIGVRQNRNSGSVPKLPPARYSYPDRPVAYYLLAAYLFYLLLTWVWNPDYGGQRDWDLFSLAAIPGALLLVYALTRSLSSAYYLAMGAIPLIAVQALHTGAWIYQNTLPWSWP